MTELTELKLRQRPKVSEFLHPRSFSVLGSVLSFAESGGAREPSRD